MNSTNFTKSLAGILLLFLILGYAPPSFSQATNATISGVVTDDGGEALIGAAVTLKNEQTGFTVSTVTNLTGNFIFSQLPLGNDYSLNLTYLGYGAKTISGYKLNQGDHIKLEIELTEEAQSLNEVSVVANSLSNSIDRFGSSTAVTAKDMNTLPVNGRNFNSLVDLSPVSNGSNLLGQLYSSTNYTIDGMTNRSPLSSGSTNRGPFSISMEAIREFEVVTNGYDVTNGRSGGGIISAVTKAGTNTFSGSAFVFNRADWLASKYDTRGNEREDEFSIQQYGFTLGGPIIKDKLHFFIGYDGQRDARPLYIADIRTPEDENRYNLSQESLDRYLQISRDKYGVADSPQTGSFDKLRYSHTAFARIDYQINPSNLLTIRNNFSRDLNNQGVSDNSSINLYEVYGSHLSTANSLMASLRTTLSNNLTNEVKLQYLYTLDDGRPSDQLPSDNIPRAIVQRVESVVDDRNVNTTIQLGGQRYLPERFESHVYQLVNNLYFNQGKINYTFGMDLLLNDLTSLATSEFNGRFYFTGLDNFDNQTPYRYAREVATVDPTVEQSIFGGGIYAQADAILGRGMNLIVGLRGDYTGYKNSPSYNQTVFDELGLRTDVKTGGFQIQPRVQFTWDVNEKQRDIVRIGGGIFGSALNNYSDVNNLQFDGTKIFAVDITGENVPTPNFESYRNDPTTAPGQDLLNLPGVMPVTTINMNSEDLKVPTVYKGNVMYNRIINNRLRLGVNFMASLARNNYMYVDRNIVDDPYFRLENEGNRGVYVPAETISTSNGNADWTQGRKTTEIGRVLELNSEGRNNTYTVVLDGTYQYFRDGQITFSYTWNDSKDNTSYNGNVANSATLSQMVIDDPRDLSMMSYSNGQYRTKIVLYGTLPTWKGITVGVRYSGIGGTRYSLRVNGNVNGDFVNSNDLAFVFDPNTSGLSETISEGMNEVLSNPDNLAVDYIKSSLGKVAVRNGGENGYFGNWDIRVAKKFYFGAAKKTGIELGGDIFNVANLLNKEWGTSKRLGNQNLLTIRNFDAATQEYIYEVNPNVGVTTPGGTPYQMQISGKIFF
ncbi:carboxypeptidase regulatory-like domain-containing protein [Algoriphagus sp. D3-2-R+10]|uniref:TonB-dependent receptor n=1 Tax=Algoriphagus aurantiacus TaxID=3103948 RepID=UPI002B3CE2A8|nr:carboxypeptidase regulatory-like domain-containing protein [Algoriphagus sp. D3-2-R+10]MEB2774140.1 carboxypeptidase regulatory-like domain-containing protein [Algoriphagus sp. D3-2-R+10]